MKTSRPTKAKEMTRFTPAGCARATVSTPSAAGRRLSRAVCAVQPFAARTCPASEALRAVKGARYPAFASIQLNTPVMMPTMATAMML